MHSHVCVSLSTNYPLGKAFYVVFASLSAFATFCNLWTGRHSNTLTDTQIQYVHTHTDTHMHMDGQMLHGPYLVNSKTR